MLGGLRFLGFDPSYITDVNNVKETCTFAISTARASSVSNLPTATVAHRFVVIRTDTDNNCIQFAFSNTMLPKDLYYRIYAGEWLGWRKISYTTT